MSATRSFPDPLGMDGGHQHQQALQQRRMAGEDARVALVDVSREGGEGAAEDLRAAGTDALFAEADVTVEAQVQAAMAQVADGGATAQ